MSADDKITFDELQVMFGAAMPVDALTILFPERHGLPASKSTAETRSALISYVLAQRNLPMRLSKDDEAMRWAMLRVVIASGMRRPVNRETLVEQVNYLASRPEVMGAWWPMVDESLDIMREGIAAGIPTDAGRAVLAGLPEETV